MSYLVRGSLTIKNQAKQLNLRQKDSPQSEFLKFHSKIVTDVVN